VERVLRKAGVLADGPLLSVYRTDAEAMVAFGRLMAQPQPPEQLAAALKP
jgi:SulP family sulfate permease